MMIFAIGSLCGSALGMQNDLSKHDNNNHRDVYQQRQKKVNRLNEIKENGELEEYFESNQMREIEKANAQESLKLEFDHDLQDASTGIFCVVVISYFLCGCK
jgi:hypothetical protein